MNETSYHHGDLRTAMIEKGMEMINEGGLKNLSLRKLAAACGVSHAAPYSHFSGKDDLFAAIQNHITDKFVIVLNEAIKNSSETSDGLFHMGCNYVLFFVRNPKYFSFLFSRANIYLDLTGESGGYEPFAIYKKLMHQLFAETQYPEELWLKTILSHWAFVHGLASVVTMSGADTIKEWEDIIPDLLANNYFLQ
ncbi:MAG: TetR/AcrR family transcriptional regulator [Lachnospiraceae bacterium]|nr:TetR/AcrR family transcriptional regulator [Lachnospiraceae bacterium]